MAHHISYLTKELQKSNHTIAELNRLCDHWHKRYNQLNDDNLRLQYEQVCVECKDVLKEALAKSYKSFTLCDICAPRVRDSPREIRSLKNQIAFWKHCYEALESDKDDTRNGHGSQRRTSTTGRSLQKTLDRGYITD